MKLSEEFFKIKDAYKSIRDKLYHIIYYMHPLCEDIDVEIKHFSQIGWNKNEIKTLCVYYNIYVNGIDYTSSEKEIPIEWLDMSKKEIVKAREEHEKRERKNYERLKKKFEE